LPEDRDEPAEAPLEPPEERAADLLDAGLLDRAAPAGPNGMPACRCSPPADAREESPRAREEEESPRGREEESPEDAVSRDGVAELRIALASRLSDFDMVAP